MGDVVVALQRVVFFMRGVVLAVLGMRAYVSMRCVDVVFQRTSVSLY